MTEYTNKNQFINVLKKFQHSFTFQFVSPELKKNREFVLEVLKINGLVLEYVSPEFQADREVVLEAVKQNGDAFEFASQKLKENREFVLKAIDINWKVLEYISPELKKEFQKDFLEFLKNQKINNLK